ncbi:MAG: ClbS/DfsB family four-helix bundle protein [Chloroflexota bacterium]|nr:ClbS/DfsB family four-helix bundle protein [Chloroflexota bacterium]
MDQATLLKTLIETRAAWEALLAQIDEEQMQRPGVAGKWSVKDIIAHVGWCESEIAPVLRTHLLAGSDLWNLSDDESNEIIYQQNKDRPLHDIVTEERQAYTALLEAVQTLSDEDLNDPQRFKNMPQEWKPWQLIAGNSFKHYEDHMPSLREWLAKKQ